MWQFSLLHRLNPSRLGRKLLGDRKIKKRMICFDATIMAEIVQTRGYSDTDGNTIPCSSDPNCNPTDPSCVGDLPIDPDIEAAYASLD